MLGEYVSKTNQSIWKMVEAEEDEPGTAKTKVTS